jgi:hypothetical protein
MPEHFLPTDRDETAVPVLEIHPEGGVLENGRNQDLIEECRARNFRLRW